MHQDRRKWINRICERRNRVQFVSNVILWSVFCFSLALAAHAATAAGSPDTDVDSLSEHSTVIIIVMASVIVALLSALVGVAVANFKDMKESIRVNHEELKREMKTKVSIAMHNAICDHKIEIEPD